MDLKQILKNLKLNESTVSVILGGVVIVLVAVLFISQTRQLSDTNGGGLDVSIPEVTGDIEAPNTEPSERENSYTVMQGDSFWSIAEKEYGSGFEWIKIAQANPDIDPLHISSGDKLTIPQAGQITEEAAATVGEPEAIPDQAAEVPEAYTVVQGDTLWDISVELYGSGYRWSEIAEVNSLVNPNIIHPGNVLQLPQS